MLVVLLGLFIVSLNSGQAALKVTIKAYNATEELGISAHAGNKKNSFTLGTRVLLTCDMSGLPEGNEVVSYRWFHNCTGYTDEMCQIRNEDPYYRVVNDTLLVDVTSNDQGGRYYCFVNFSTTQRGLPPSNTTIFTVAGYPGPFLYTPISLLPEHSVLTNVQQVTGRNGQQWITCRSGGQGTRPQIWMGSELVANNSTANSATIGLGTQRPNGLYHCLSAHFSLFLKNPGPSVTLPAPNFVRARDSSMWTLTSPDGSQVERYIVEFECRVRNMTFVERYMSVRASGGTGRVATSVSCFGGLGQLYRVKVWAVSGPNISHALVYIPDGQCREEGELLTIDTFIEVLLGSSMFLLLALSILVVTILVIVAAAVKRKATCKQTRDLAMIDNPCYNTVVRQLAMEMKEKDADNHDKCADGDESIGKVKGEEDAPIPVTIDVYQYEDVDRELHSKSTKTLAAKESSTPASATNEPAIYAVVDKSKKKGINQTSDGSTAINKVELYAMPMEKKGKITDKCEDMIGSGGVEEGEQYDDTVEYKPKVDSELSN